MTKGRYEGNEYPEIAEELDLEGWFDEEAGSIPEYGFWFGLVRFDQPKVIDDQRFVGAICMEDEYGFFDAVLYEDANELEADWSEILEVF